MVNNRSLFWFLFIVCLYSQNSNGTVSKLSLTPKKAAELALSQGYYAEESDLSYTISKYSLYQARASFDWKLNFETGLEKDRSQSFSPGTLIDAKYDRYKTTLGLQRYFSSGTSLAVNMNRLSQKAEINTIINPTATTPSEQTQDIYGLVLEQNLWKDFFGDASRAGLRAVDLSFEVESLNRLNSLQNSVLESMKLFWEAYVARENFREAQAAFERYQKLVVSIQRKTSVGYSAPGELSQVQAELELRNQNLQTTSMDFVKKSDALAIYIKLDPSTDIDFQVDASLPEPPKTIDANIEELRAYHIQKKKLESANYTAMAAESNAHPSFSVVGQATVTGSDTNPGSSMSEALSAIYPKYYAGVKLAWSFGSGSEEELAVAKRASRLLEENRLEKLKRELTDQKELIGLKLKTTHFAAVSNQKYRDLRQKVVQELTRTYQQGRTELKSLIDAMNLLSLAEIQKIRSVGDYQFALTEWTAYTDQLVTQRDPKP